MVLQVTDEFEYELFKPITHHQGGEEVEINKLTLRCPTPKNRNDTNKLRQHFMHAVNDVASKGQPDVNLDGKSAANEITGNAVYLLFLGSQVDIVDCFECLSRILLKGCAFIDGKTQIITTHFNQLSDDDLGGILGEYVARFLVPSAMRSAMAN